MGIGGIMKPENLGTIDAYDDYTKDLNSVSRAFRELIRPTVRAFDIFKEVTQNISTLEQYQNAERHYKLFESTHDRFSSSNMKFPRIPQFMKLIPQKASNMMDEARQLLEQLRTDHAILFTNKQAYTNLARYIRDFSSTLDVTLTADDVDDGRYELNYSDIIEELKRYTEPLPLTFDQQMDRMYELFDKHVCLLVPAVRHMKDLAQNLSTDEHFKEVEQWYQRFANYGKDYARLKRAIHSECKRQDPGFTRHSLKAIPGFAMLDRNYHFLCFAAYDIRKRTQERYASFKAEKDRRRREATQYSDVEYIMDIAPYLTEEQAREVLRMESSSALQAANWIAGRDPEYVLRRIAGVC